MCAQEAQEFGFLCGKFCYLVIDEKHLFLGIESEFTNLIHGNFFAFLAFDTAKDGFDTEHKFLHRERFGDIVVRTDLESFEDVFLD